MTDLHPNHDVFHLGQECHGRPPRIEKLTLSSAAVRLKAGGADRIRKKVSRAESLLQPVLPSVANPKNVNGFAIDAVRDYVWQGKGDEFSRAGNGPRCGREWREAQRICGSKQMARGGPRTFFGIRCLVPNNPGQVGRRLRRPSNQSHNFSICSSPASISS